MFKVALVYINVKSYHEVMKELFLKAGWKHQAHEC